MWDDWHTTDLRKCPGKDDCREEEHWNPFDRLFTISWEWCCPQWNVRTSCINKLMTSPELVYTDARDVYRGRYSLAEAGWRSTWRKTKIRCRKCTMKSSVTVPKPIGKFWFLSLHTSFHFYPPIACFRGKGKALRATSPPSELPA